MKHTLLISAVLLSILISALWFSQLEPEPLQPQPVEVVTVAPPTEVPLTPRQPSTEPSAPDPRPPPPQTVHLTLHVSRGTKTAVGERVGIAAGFFSTLTNSFHRTSSLVDAMGDASFDIVPGPWTITGPEGASPVHLEVTPTSTRFEIQLPERFTITGVVVDGHELPVSGAKIVGCRAFSDSTGRFSCVVDSQQVVLQAVSGWRMSTAQTVTLPAAEVRLQLQDTVSLEVTTRVPKANVLVSHPGGLWICQTPCKGRVLSGSVRARASVESGNGVLIGTAAALVTGASASLAVPLLPAPPLTGIVHDESGAPLRGVTVRPASVAWQFVDHSLLRATDPDGPYPPEITTSPDRRERDAKSRPLGSLITDELGRFALPNASAEPLLFTLEGPWREKQLTIATPDTKEIELVAVPYEPQ